LAPHDVLVQNAIIGVIVPQDRNPVPVYRAGMRT